MPGLYAWTVTVAPLAWAHDAPAVARLAALVAPTILVAGVASDRSATRTRAVWLWGFVAACGVAWGLAPGALAPRHLDPWRGMAGALGWGLFAAASASPPLDRDRAASPIVREEHPNRRRRARGADVAAITVGALIALSLQLVGWSVPYPERALLIRFVALVAGLALMGVATDVALASRSGLARRAAGPILRNAVLPALVLGVLAVAGLLFAGRD